VQKLVVAANGTRSRTLTARGRQRQGKDYHFDFSKWSAPDSEDEEHGGESDNQVATGVDQGASGNKTGRGQKGKGQVKAPQQQQQQQQEQQQQEQQQQRKKKSKGEGGSGGRGKLGTDGVAPRDRNMAPAVTSILATLCEQVRMICSLESTNLNHVALP
jgi:hypothetical protein